MGDHFIKNIEIKNFKCFKDFKAEGLGRVNLIGGKNNVGKTAFMEACYYASFNSLEERKNAYMIIKFNRNPIEFINNRYNMYNNFQFSEFLLNGDDVTNYNPFTILADNEKKAIREDIYFISLATNFNEELLINTVGELKLNNRYNQLNKYMNDIFNIENIDVIKNKLMLKSNSNNKYKPLDYFGDGIIHYISILLSLLTNKNTIIYLDEIENGIHYTNLDKLWEIILTISKQQNVQVFATTHSKECIESYARVAKKLEDEDITFIKMTRLEDGSIMAGVRDYETLQYAVEDGHEVRGW